MFAPYATLGSKKSDDDDDADDDNADDGELDIFVFYAKNKDRKNFLGFPRGKLAL